MSQVHAESAIGLISTQSFPAMVGTADMMIKSAAVTLVGYEKIGNGYCTAVVRGRYPDVKLAVAEGAEVAKQMGELVWQSVISRPAPNLSAVLPINDRILAQITGKSKLANLAVGLLETRGFPAMVAAMDEMLKTADVYVSGYEKTGAGLCTAIVRGTVTNVTMALDAGMSVAERIGELRSIMVIPRPLADLERTIPTASYWLEPVLTIPEPQQQPLVIPERQPVAVPLQLPQTVEVPMVEVEVVEAESALVQENLKSLDEPDDSLDSRR
jgi:carbon dioxide concentrating mechanism protein CcmO